MGGASCPRSGRAGGLAEGLWGQGRSRGRGRPGSCLAAAGKEGGDGTTGAAEPGAGRPRGASELCSRPEVHPSGGQAPVPPPGSGVRQAWSWLGLLFPWLQGPSGWAGTTTGLWEAGASAPSQPAFSWPKLGLVPTSPPLLWLPSRRVSLGLHPLCLTPSPGNDGQAQLGESWRGQESGSMVKQLPWPEGTGPSLGAGAGPARVESGAGCGRGRGTWQLPGPKALAMVQQEGGRRPGRGPGRCVLGSAAWPGLVGGGWWVPGLGKVSWAPT